MSVSDKQRAMAVSAVLLVAASLTGCSDDAVAPQDPKTTTVSVSPGEVGHYLPPKKGTRGDMDFAGHGPDITLKAELHIVDAVLVTCDLFMRAVEFDIVGGGDGDGSAAEGTRTYTVYEATDGWRIAGMEPVARYGYVTYVDNNHFTDLHACPGFLFQSYGDGDGDDIGVHTGVTVWVHDFEVELREE